VNRLAAFIVFLFSTLSSIVGADDGKGTSADPYIVPKASSTIKVDGLLDEQAWKDALVLELNYEVRPGENVPPPVRTEVLLTYENGYLYAAFRAYDPEPTAIRAHLGDHDNIGPDDWVALIFDTFNDERRCFDFLINPLGVQYDQIETQTSEDSSWDTIWDSAGKITDWGYAVEIAIPFNSLRFQRIDGDQVWGFDAVRSYPRNVRHHIGLFPRDRNNNCYLCQAIKIKGFAGADPGRNMEINPTVTGVRTDERSSLPDGEFENVDSEAEVGLTARWGITPNMTLSATVNPDFSQVEADALQLDINERFALYYYEKRPFFTEGAEYFSMPTDAVYTRTMHNPVWGLKLTGKEGANSVGAYLVRDQVTNLIFPGSQYSNATSLDMESTATILRYKRDIWNNSNVGFMITDRRGEDYYNTFYAVDGRLRFSSKDRLTFLVGGTQTRYPGELARSFDQPVGDFGDLGWSVDYTHSTRNYYVYGEYVDVGKDVRVDLGFIPQVGYKQMEVGGGYIWQGDSKDFFNRFQVSANWDKTDQQDGSPLEEEYEANVSFQGPKESFGSVNIGTRDLYFQGVKFDQRYQNFSYSIRPKGNFYTGIYFQYGDTIDYSHIRAAKGITIMPEWSCNLGPSLKFYMDYQLRQLSVEGERLFLTNTVDSTLVYQFNVRTFFRAIVQFADIRRNLDLYSYPVEQLTRTLFTQLLFSYKINPRTVLFLGYSDNYLGSDDFGLTQTGRTFFVKLGYAWVL
jgi:hypothetical protein